MRYIYFIIDAIVRVRMHKNHTSLIKPNFLFVSILIESQIIIYINNFIAVLLCIIVMVLHFFLSKKILLIFFFVPRTHSITFIKRRFILHIRNLLLIISVDRNKGQLHYNFSIKGVLTNITHY